MISIQTPMWKNGGCVGIAQKKLKEEGPVTTVQILYKNRHNLRQFPGKYTIPTENVRRYPTMTVRNGTILHIVPIGDFTHDSMYSQENN